MHYDDDSSHVICSTEALIVHEVEWRITFKNLSEGFLSTKALLYVIVTMEKEKLTPRAKPYISFLKQVCIKLISLFKNNLL